MFLSLLISIFVLLFAVWMAGAIYFDVGGQSKWSAVAAAAWIALVIVWLLFWQPTWQPAMFVAFLGAIFVVWWLRIPPSNDRDWEPNSAVLACFHQEGDRLTIKNLRNTTYRSLTDYDPHYEERTLRLSRLTSVDMLLFYWGSKWMAHPILVFDFGDDGRLAVSIEVRYRKGQPYSLIRSLYRQQELIYVVADERDVILRRTNCEPVNDGYLYRLSATEQDVRRLFSDYLATVNRLHEKPEWYNGLTRNCTTSIYRHPHSQGRFDWRILVNGKLDECLYDRGRLNQSLDFAKLKQGSYINEIVNHAPSEGFGDYLRESLAAYQAATDEIHVG